MWVYCSTEIPRSMPGTPLGSTAKASTVNGIPASVSAAGWHEGSIEAEGAASFLQLVNYSSLWATEGRHFVSALLIPKLFSSYPTRGCPRMLYIETVMASASLDQSRLCLACRPQWSALPSRGLTWASLHCLTQQHLHGETLDSRAWLQ